jgi:hypothetical protein
MKFLIDHDRTRDLLNEWALNCSVYAHFIWNSGTQPQRSILGLLRSLLFQIVEKNDYIASLQTPNIMSKRNPADWSRVDLETTLLRTLREHGGGSCIFIDGLDEIDPRDGPFDLLNLVEQISSLSNIKICVSSRGENAFKMRLGSCPKLRLQDLTKLDVEVYAKDFVKNKCSFDLSGIDERGFIEEIVTKANGVFLWVSLALKSLQRGVTNGDDPAKLMERLHKLPSELEKLYEEMLKRLGDDEEIYSKEAAMIFNTFILMSSLAIYNYRAPRWNLLQHAIAFDPTLRGKLLKLDSLPDQMSLRKILLDVDPKLTSRCAGILEVVSHSHEEQDIPQLLSRATYRPWETIGVEFLHRSAKDFLLNSRNLLLDQDPTLAAERKFGVVQAIVLDDIYPPSDHKQHLSFAMNIMRKTVLSFSDEQEVKILNLMKEIYQRNRWPEFYELAARHGFRRPIDHLFETSPGDIGPLRSYLLLCALSQYTPRISATVSHLLQMGAYSSNSVALKQIRIPGGGSVYSLVPLLGHLFENAFGYSSLPNGGFIENIIQSFIECGADLEETFFHRHSWKPTVQDTTTCRPLYSCNVLHTGKHLIVEVNSVDIIVERYLKQFSPVERSTTASRLGLEASRARCKILLYFDEGIAYGADDEDSEALNKILGWPKSRTSLSDENIDNFSRRVVQVDDKPEKILELLKGKEVKDVKKWLVDRGYTLVDEKDIEGISNEATVHEMAAIYQRLGEKYAHRRRK